MRKSISFTFYTASAVILLWCLVSYVDIIAHNVNPTPVYWQYNLFTLLCGR